LVAFTGRADVIEEDGLCTRATELVDVRGPGFIIVSESNRMDGPRPNPEFANAVRTEALSHGLVLLICGVYGNVIRFWAPWTIEGAMGVLDASFASAKGT